MKLWEAARVAWSGLSGNKLRSMLTMLGVIIGVAAVVALVAVGQGATAQVTAQIQGLGSDLIIISARSPNRLDLTDATTLPSRVPTLLRAVASLSLSTTAKWQNRTHQTTVEGATEEFPAVRNFPVQTGRFFSADDVAAQRRVAVLGQTVATELFLAGSPVGETIQVMGQPFLVIGVLERKGSSFGRDQDNTIVIPVTTAQRLAGVRRIATIYAQAAPDADVTATLAHIRAVFDHRFRRDDSITAQSQDDVLATIGTATRTLTLMLGSIAGISLLVGGIGIMNIMLVSVTERTREIGVRKALGARRRDILLQFLVEAIFLSVTGGLLGAALGAQGARLVSRLAGWNTIVSPESVLVALGFAAAVGIIFGVYPAAKAARLDAIQALRYE